MVPGRRAHRAAHPGLHPLERGGHGHPGQQAATGIGGHLATYASSAALYEVGFNHFFRGKDDGQAGDQVFFQGHAAPGIYARAFLEGRLTETQLDNFRQEIGGSGPVQLPPPPAHARLLGVPHRLAWASAPSTPSTRPGSTATCANRRIADTSQSPGLGLPGRRRVRRARVPGRPHAWPPGSHLDNLIFVVNCNLQRLDGPVRGNGKIIQEMEALFRGAGWNVIKVIWGSGWDELLARDVDGVLLNKMNTTLDGEFQKYSIESGAYIREHFFGPDPRLRAMVEHLSDDELRNLPRGGHDYRKLYAAYSAAVERNGAPTAILAKTIKGWTLGPGVEARNATHQIKKMSKKHLASSATGSTSTTCSPTRPSRTPTSRPTTARPRARPSTST